MQDMQPGMTCNHCDSHMGCKCFHHKIVPLSIILIGLAFLLEAFGMLSASTVSIAWPLFLILIGVMKLTKGMCKCCGMGAKKM